jgi:phospholipid/cholesterol/gamma-HCH transport system substrate-binding protein
MLAEGDRITKTQSAVVIEKLISQFLFEKAQEGGGAKEPASVPPAAPAGKATQGAKK